MPGWAEEIRRRLADAGLDPAREEEIGQHLDDRYAEMRAIGRSEADARQAAIDELGEEFRMREELARVTPAAPGVLPPGTPATRRALAERWQDIRYALRMLRRSLGFTAVAVLTLAVGIGATVAIVSAAYSVLYRPLEVTEANRVVVPVSVNSGRGVDRGSIPFADYADWRNERDVFERVALFSSTQMDIAGGETPERVSALQVSAEYFDAMKVRPLGGRLLVPSDHEADAAPVVVIGESVWKRRFGGDAQIVGKPVRLAGTERTIVGVVAPQRLWPAKQEVWLPMQPSAMPEDVRVRRDNMIFMAVARLQPGIHLTQARARVQAVASRVTRDHPASRKDWTSDVIPLREYVVEPDVRLGMMVLLGGVGFVLLIACVNLANLLLARGADRAREMALRSALGASRPRLLRQLMTESLVLAVAGGVSGLLIARWLLQGLKAAVPPELPMAERLEADGITVAIALGLTCVTALLFGLLPALAASTFNLADGLREGGRTAGAAVARGASVTHSSSHRLRSRSSC